MSARLSAAAPALDLAAAPHGRASWSLFSGADPHGLVAEGRYWVYPTGDGDSLRAWSSDDLTTWTEHAPLLRQKDIAWVKDDGAHRRYLWAPHMQAANGKYYLYYSLGPQTPTPSRIGVAVSQTPQGPCVDSGRPLLTGGEGFEAIDPHVFVDPKSGRIYLYAGGSAGSTLRAFELAPDMISIVGEIDVDQPPGFTEAAFMHYRDGVYYLSYSHGRWNEASYSVRYAVSSSPTGPWSYQGVVLQSDRAHKGPGHHSFFQDPKDGQWYVVYGRWEGEAGDGPYRGDRRKIAIAPVAYSSAGLIEPINMAPGEPQLAAAE
jgi:beta-xylosidase